MFPPPPNGRIRRKYKTVIKLRQGRFGTEAEFKATENPFALTRAQWQQLTGQSNTDSFNDLLSGASIEYKVYDYGMPGFPAQPSAGSGTDPSPMNAPLKLKSFPGFGKVGVQLPSHSERKNLGDTPEFDLLGPQTLEEIWDSCNKAIAEVTCPFCLYALPSLSVGNEKKWR